MLRAFGAIVKMDGIREVAESRMSVPANRAGSKVANNKGKSQRSEKSHREATNVVIVAT